MRNYWYGIGIILFSWAFDFMSGLLDNTVYSNVATFFGVIAFVEMLTISTIYLLPDIPRFTRPMVIVLICSIIVQFAGIYLYAYDLTWIYTELVNFGFLIQLGIMLNAGIYLSRISRGHNTTEPGQGNTNDVRQGEKTG